MADVINLIGRLNAFRRGRAVRIATHLQVNIAPHALVIAPLAMAGEDTTVHAVAIGRIGGPPQVRVVPDPRVRDDHYALIAWLGDIVEDYYQECRDNEVYPQIWVSSAGAAGHLDILADRLRFTRDAPRIKRTGDLLTYATERRPIAGQQALMTVTGTLALHFATGQQDGEDEHLGAFLVWLDPPEGVDIRRAIELAERQVMGVKTDPEFDRIELQPRLSAYNEARKSGAPATTIARHVAGIEAVLEPIVRDIYAAIQTGIGFIRGQFPEAAILANLAEHEAQEFLNFMNARDAERPLPYRDTPKAGAFKISQREVSIQNLEAGAIYGDTMAQARARLAGVILTGNVANPRQVKVSRKTLQTFDVETPQTNLHLRSGDTLALMRDTRMSCVVEDVQRVGQMTRVSLRVRAGMKAVGLPANGLVVDFAPPPPDWQHLMRLRGKMSERLAAPVWTHTRDAAVPAPAAAPAIPRPNNLLADLERLK